MTNDGSDESVDTNPRSGAGQSSEDAVSPDVLELDHLYSALGHPRRRYLCYTLLEDDEWSLRDLATKIAAWEHDIAENAVTDDQRDRVYISLYHAHVQKLVDVGVVTFDETDELIAAGDHAEQVLAALDGIGATLDSRRETHAREQEDDE